MIIDVVDMEDPILGTELMKALSGVGSRVVQMYGMSNGIEQMVNSVAQAAQQVSSIEALRIWSHGLGGAQNISSGAVVVGSRSGLTSKNVVTTSPVLLRLKPYFAPGARVELRGCGVAEGEKGESLMTSLARIWGVNVQAGVISESGINWVGPVHVATPEGVMFSTVGTPIK